MTNRNHDSTIRQDCARPSAAEPAPKMKPSEEPTRRLGGARDEAGDTAMSSIDDHAEQRTVDGGHNAAGGGTKSEIGTRAAGRVVGTEAISGDAGTESVKQDANRPSRVEEADVKAMKLSKLLGSFPRLCIPPAGGPKRHRDAHPPRKELSAGGDESIPDDEAPARESDSTRPVSTLAPAGPDGRQEGHERVQDDDTYQRSLFREGGFVKFVESVVAKTKTRYPKGSLHAIFTNEAYRIVKREHRGSTPSSNLAFLTRVINAAPGGFFFLTGACGRVANWSTLFPLLLPFFQAGGSGLIVLSTQELSLETFEEAQAWQQVIEATGRLRFVFAKLDSSNLCDGIVVAPGGEMVDITLSRIREPRDVGVFDASTTIAAVPELAERMTVHRLSFEEEEAREQVEEIAEFWFDLAQDNHLFDQDDELLQTRSLLRDLDDIRSRKKSTLLRRVAQYIEGQDRAEMRRGIGALRDTFPGAFPELAAAFAREETPDPLTGPIRLSDDARAAISQFVSAKEAARANRADFYRQGWTGDELVAIPASIGRDGQFSAQANPRFPPRSPTTMSLSNGNSYQSKGVGDRAGGSHMTSTTRGDHVPKLVRALQFKCNHPFLEAFYTASPAGKKRLCKALGIKRKKQAAAHSDAHTAAESPDGHQTRESRKRSQQKRDSALEPAQMSRLKKSKVNNVDADVLQATLERVAHGVVEQEEEESGAGCDQRSDDLPDLSRRAEPNAPSRVE
ncbi:hypothetical protein JCM11491_000969 [Sporobolomyces phaffii]